MKKLFVAVLIVLGSVSLLNAQPLYLPERYGCLSDTNSFMLKVNGSSYFYNYEYFKPYALGFTQPGFSVIPTLEANFGSKLVIGGGVHLKKYWGDTPFGEVSPVLFARYEAAKNFFVQVGTINSSDGHMLSEILYNPLYKIDIRQENGLQLRYYGNRIFADAWVSWEHYLKEGVDDQEHLTAGLSLLAKLTSDSNPFEVSIPFQNTFQHWGGQINDKKDTLKKVRTIANLSLGLQVAYKIDGYKKVGILVQGVKMNDSYDFKPQNGEGGSMALWSTLFFKTNALNLQLGYLYGKRFYTNLGDKIFNTITFNYSDVVTSRSQFSATGSYATKPYKGITFRVDAGGYLDTKDTGIDYYYGVGVLFDFSVLKRSFPTL